MMDSFLKGGSVRLIFVGTASHNIVRLPMT